MTILMGHSWRSFGAILLAICSFCCIAKGACATGPSGTVSVLFVNGILTTNADADDERQAVEKELQDAITSGALKRDKDCLLVSLGWNPTVSLWGDALESAYQLSISDSTAWKIVYGLLIDDLLSRRIISLEELYLTGILEAATVDKITNLATTHLTMGKLVLLGHSQGTLFANRVYYDRLSVSQQSDTTVVAVATPADRVPGGRYTTLKKDLIALLPGALIGNADNGPCGSEQQCHDFLHSYLPLTNGRESGPQIRDQLIDAIGPTGSQSIIASNDKGIPNTPFGLIIQFNPSFNADVSSLQFFGGVLHGAGGITDTFQLYEGTGGTGVPLDCQPIHQTFSQWGLPEGVASADRPLGIVLMDGWHGTQCQVKLGHTYFITGFQGQYMWAGGYAGATTLETTLYYFIRSGNQSGGAISVTTNLAVALFSIAGPTTYTAGGTSFVASNTPAGTYTITYGLVPGYITPPGETKNLPAGELIRFSGAYSGVIASHDEGIPNLPLGLILNFSPTLTAPLSSFRFYAGALYNAGGITDTFQLFTTDTNQSGNGYDALDCQPTHKTFSQWGFAIGIGPSDRPLAPVMMDGWHGTQCQLQIGHHYFITGFQGQYMWAGGYSSDSMFYYVIK